MPTTALLLIDVINAFDFDGGELLVEQATTTIAPIKRLITKARAAGAPIIYANDNYGNWTETFDTLVARCQSDDNRGCEVVRALAPQDGDHFILKPKHSAFYLTPLDALLKQLDAERLVICGYAGDICVLFTANDAYMREYSVCVPEDAVASETADGNACALTMLRENLSVDTAPVVAVEFRQEVEAEV